MFLLIYGLLWIFFNVCCDLIEEKLLCWLLELLNMFELDKNYILENCGCWYVSLLHFICIMVVWRKKDYWKVAWNGKMKKKWWWKVKARERQIKKRVRSLVWKIQKFTMGRVFGYERVSFGESPRIIVHCMIMCYILTCILFNC